MVNMTLAIPEDLKKEMEKRPEIKWSEIARRAMADYAKKLAYVDSLARKSKLTEKDAQELGRILKRRIAERHEL